MDNLADFKPSLILKHDEQLQNLSNFQIKEEVDLIKLTRVCRCLTQFYGNIEGGAWFASIWGIIRPRNPILDGSSWPYILLIELRVGGTRRHTCIKAIRSGEINDFPFIYRHHHHRAYMLNMMFLCFHLCLSFCLGIIARKWLIDHFRPLHHGLLGLLG